MLRNRKLTIGSAIVVALVACMMMSAFGDFTPTVSQAEASQMYGGACSWWNDEGDGCMDDDDCGTTGTQYEPDTWWSVADEYGERTDADCSATEPECGKYDVVGGCGY